MSGEYIRRAVELLLDGNEYSTEINGETYTLKVTNGRLYWTNGNMSTPSGIGNNLFISEFDMSREDFIKMVSGALGERNSSYGKQKKSGNRQITKERVCLFEREILSEHGYSERNAPRENLRILDGLRVDQLSKDIKNSPDMLSRYQDPKNPRKDITPKVSHDLGFVRKRLREKIEGLLS